MARIAEGLRLSRQGERAAAREHLACGRASLAALPTTATATAGRSATGSDLLERRLAAAGSPVR
jgi:hypothetical protein